MRRELAERCSQLMALQIEMQRVRGERALDRQLIEDLERQVDEAAQQMREMREEETEAFTSFKAAFLEEIRSLRKAVDSIGKSLGCIMCKKISTDSQMLGCGHAVCSECAFRQGETVACEECQSRTEVRALARSPVMKASGIGYLLAKKIIESLSKMAS